MGFIELGALARGLSAGLAYHRPLIDISRESAAGNPVPKGPLRREGEDLGIARRGGRPPPFP